MVINMGMLVLLYNLILYFVTPIVNTLSSLSLIIVGMSVFYFPFFLTDTERTDAPGSLTLFIYVSVQELAISPSSIGILS